MKRRFTLALAGLAAITASIAFAQSRDTSPNAPASQKEKKAATGAPQDLPPGMTAEDMQACKEAAQPGPMHEFLSEAVGVWQGKTKMWMAPDADPVESECTSTITAMMDGRFTKCEIDGDMPGMEAPFKGFGIYGFDNVSEKFQSSWIDNCGTGIMTGTGDLSSDGTTLTWNYTYNCPMTKKPTKMREVDRRNGPNSSTLEMYMTDPASGEEFKMMEIALTRKPGGISSTRQP